MQLLKDKVVFLTGGTEGIGYECAAVYHRAGAKVSIITHKENSLQQCRSQFFDDNIHYILADVSSAADVQRAIAETLARFGKINIIHNNAGVSNPSKTVCATTDEEWNRVFNVNVKGIYNTTKFGIEALKATSGNILNSSSLVGDIGQELHAAYTATKGAVNALTKSMALDYAPYGVRVNAVAPAGVWTPMLRRWSSQQPNAAHIETYLDGIHPLGYCPEGDVVADACLFLVSEQARFITGCILPVSGGAELGYRRYTGQPGRANAIVDEKVTLS
ncbi:SDR family oxidoreductase [Mucilaginibacter sp. 14171R-50]|uniref:SDR family NAD(P)-dependent oxidoreductase n=1 Tax=Mucilaginibacter sp. 14171R-50 TaxID=2703789 RepID=UPI00138C8E55|nr:SDR family oxidoreductase [Mucilaginibacter sp. 14171R-50]QHS56963.1 SDR family oxidoreductase [Mucilaginibacter sp. 14171R-50]